MPCETPEAPLGQNPGGIAAARIEMAGALDQPWGLGSAMVRGANRAFGERDSAGRERVNKSEIAGRVADRSGVGRSAAGEAVDAVFVAIAEAQARGEDVRIAGFGTFGTRSRSACTGRNPRTGEILEITASTAPTFKAGKPLRDAVNEGNAS